MFSSKMLEKSNLLEISISFGAANSAFFISGNSEKSYQKIVKMAIFCKKIFLHSGLPKPNANSGHKFCNPFGSIQTPLK